jgi:NADH:ubiquinone oxidoreductase subunit 6 (subunit J)
LAGTSALVALLIFMMGAPQVAAIELSVGAGLVTVLFVFAINIAGEENLDRRPVIPAPVAWVLVGASLVLLGWLNLPNLNLPLSVSTGSQFGSIFWEQRGLDVLVQIALIFCGVLGVLGLLSAPKNAEGGS